MASKHITEDEVNLLINAKVSQAQQEIRKFEKDIDKLESRNKSLRKQMDSLELAGKKDAESWKKRRAEYGKNVQEIKRLKQEIAEETKKLDINSLSMAQLRKQAKSLQRELDNTAKAVHPEEYDKLQKQLTKVKGRMEELKVSAQGFKESMLDDTTFSFLKGTLFVKFAEIAGQALSHVVGKVKEMVSEGIEMAESADGVAHAFRQLDNNEGLLKNLRAATKGTVNDFELMKAAMKAKDFRIPLEDLGKLLSFAQLKAQQTGQSVDYMVDSIVTGLGRQSKMILDNLGISAAEIDEKIQETGDFAKAVASIVNTQLKEAGDTYVSAADRALQRTTNLENAQRELGESLLPLKERMEEAYGAAVMGTADVIKWCMKHGSALKQLIVLIGTFVVAAGLQRAAILKNTVSIKAGTTALRAHIAANKELQLLMSPIRALVNGISLAWFRWTGNVTKARIALVAFTKAMRMVPYLAVATIIIGIATALYKLATRAKETNPYLEKIDASMKRMEEQSKKTTTQMKQDLKDIDKQAKSTYTEQKTKLELLTKTVNDNTKSVKKRREALDEIKKMVPAYHAQLTNEGKLINNNTSALKEYTKNLYKAALAQAALGKINSYADKMLDRQQWLTGRENNQKWVKQEASKIGYDVENRQVEKGSGPGAKYWIKDRGTKDGNLRYISEKEYKEMARFNDLYEYNIQSIQEHTQVMEGYNKSIDNIVKATEKQGVDLNKALGGNGGSETPTSSTPGKDNSNKDESDAIKKWKMARQQAIDDENRIYDAATKQLQQKLYDANEENRITQQEYDNLMMGLKLGHQENLLKVEQQYLDESQQLQIKDATRKQEIVTEQNRNVEKAQKDSEQARLDAAKLYYTQVQTLEEKGQSDQERKKRDHDLQLEALKGYYQAALQYAQEHNQETLSIDLAYQKAKAKLEKDFELQNQKEIFDIRQQYGLVKQEELYNQELKILKQHLDQKKLTQEEYEQAMANLHQQYEDKKFQVRQQYGLVSQAELWEQQKEQLLQQHEDGYLTEAEYQEALKQMRMESWKEQFDYYHQLFADAVGALQDAEMANIDAKYDAEIEAARKAGKDVTALENKKANDKLKVEKKYADVDFAIKAAQIVADTVVGITKLWASPGYPMAIPLTVLLAALGTANLIAANAQRQKVKSMTLNGGGGSSASGARVATGRESGGWLDVEREQDGRRFHAKYDPKKRGFVNQPTVIVGEGPRPKEWIASNDAVENPTVAPFIDILDRVQRAGQLRTFDFNKYLLHQKAKGYAAGGSLPSAPSGSCPPPTAPSMDPQTQRLADILDRLDRDGLPVYLGLDELDAQQRIRDRIRNLAKKE